VPATSEIAPSDPPADGGETALSAESAAVGLSGRASWSSPDPACPYEKRLAWRRRRDEDERDTDPDGGRGRDTSGSKNADAPIANRRARRVPNVPGPYCGRARPRTTSSRRIFFLLSGHNVTTSPHEPRPPPQGRRTISRSMIRMRGGRSSRGAELRARPTCSARSGFLREQLQRLFAARRYREASRGWALCLRARLMRPETAGIPYASVRGYGHDLAGGAARGVNWVPRAGGGSRAGRPPGCIGEGIDAPTDLASSGKVEKQQSKFRENLSRAKALTYREKGEATGSITGEWVGRANTPSTTSFYVAREPPTRRAALAERSFPRSFLRARHGGRRGDRTHSIGSGLYGEGNAPSSPPDHRRESSRGQAARPARQGVRMGGAGAFRRAGGTTSLPLRVRTPASKRRFPFEQGGGSGRKRNWAATAKVSSIFSPLA